MIAITGYILGVIFSFVLGVLISCLAHKVDATLIIRPGNKTELDLSKLKLEEGTILHICVHYDYDIESQEKDAL